jgi:hypothetical protein
LNKINKMSQLSGIKDVDREILSKLDDRDLLKTCSIDRYTWEKVCDDAFLKRRLLFKYPEIGEYKMETETWKHFFLRAVNYIALMKENFDYVYTFGDFQKQYNLLKKYKNKNNLLLFSSKVGELALVIWSLKSGANIHDGNDYALRFASENGHLETVKYLVEAGADIHAENDYALRWASRKGHLETVKYLVNAGADIHAFNDAALRWASKNGRLEMVKYLVESGADIHADNDYALRSASENGRLDIVNYLKSKM